MSLKKNIPDAAKKLFGLKKAKPKSRRAVIHIGRYKTGSSALQRWLTDNSEFLAEHNFLYPEKGRLEDWPFAHHVAADFLEETGKLPDDLVEEIGASDNNILLSCEAFGEIAIHSPSYLSEFARVFEGFKIEIVYFTRHPNPWIESFYREQVMRGEMHRGIESFSTFLKHEEDHLSDEKLLAPWRTAIPSASFHVISYEDSLNGNGVAASLLSALGLPQNRVSLETPIENTGLPEAYLHFLREMRPEFGEDIAPYNRMINAVWRLKARLDTKPGPLVIRTQEDNAIITAAEEEYGRFLKRALKR